VLGFGPVCFGQKPQKLEKNYREWLERPEYRHLRVVRLTSQAEIERWLSLCAPGERT